MSFWNRIEKSPDPVPAGAEPQPAAPPPLPGPAAEPAFVEPPKAQAAPPKAQAAPPAQPDPPNLTLGRGVRLEGKLTFSGTVRIDATFQGSIVTDGVLVVGKGAKVDANVSCGTIIVEGDVTGDVIASAGVELRSTARLRGDVETPSLAVDRGAIVEGALRRPRGTASSDRRAGKAVAAPAPSAG
jgi:cytoskeletal protein CcmA (bactofilin family)